MKRDVLAINEAEWDLQGLYTEVRERMAGRMEGGTTVLEEGQG